MAIQQKLHTKLVQKLILTPSLQQAIKLLPMSTLELADLLNQEMVENPLLEEVPTEELAAGRAAAGPRKPGGAGSPQAEKTDTWDDADYDYFFGDYLDDGYRLARPVGGQGAAADREHAVDGRLALRSPALAAVDADRRRHAAAEIGAAIIGNLDDDGYLVASVDEIAAMGDVAGRRRSSRRCSTCRRFDPDRRRARATCRNASGCSSGTSASRARRPRRSSPSTCGCCRTIRCRRSPASSGMTIEDLKEHIEIIRNLDPKPGSRYNPTQSQYVIPDVYVVKVEDQYVARAERGRPAAAAHQPGLPAAARQERRRDERRDARLREGQVPLGAVADQVGRAAAEDDPQGRDAASSTSSATSSITASSTSGRWCCATSPTTSACTSRRSAAW